MTAKSPVYTSVLVYRSAKSEAVDTLAVSGITMLHGYVSRAFALYYAVQAMIAAKGAWAGPRGAGKAAAFAVLGILGLAIAVFGSAVE
jgi:hypothetical protein